MEKPIGRGELKIPFQWFLQRYQGGLTSEYFQQALGHVPPKMTVDNYHLGVLRVSTPSVPFNISIVFFTEEVLGDGKQGVNINASSRVGDRMHSLGYRSRLAGDPKELVLDTIWIQGKQAKDLPMGFDDEKTTYHSQSFTSGQRNLLSLTQVDGQYRLDTGRLPYSVAPIPDTDLYEFTGLFDGVYCKRPFSFPFPPVITLR